MMTNYHFDKEVVKAHDIFFAEHYDLNGEKYGHYFYCIYNQEEDEELGLFRDVIGLLITTKEAKGYVATININGKEAHVLCDKEVRFIADRKNIKNKYIKISKEEKVIVMEMYKKFCKEKIKQLKKGSRKWK